MDHQPLNISNNDETLWHLLSTRSPSAEGRFLYGVKTTRIFCRPTCKARLARRHNILYFANAAQAQLAGFRACKRCKPDLVAVQVFAPEADNIFRVCASVREALGKGEKVPGLREMAELAGLTKFHFHRLFKREMGVTPREFVKGLVGERRVREKSSGCPPLVSDSSPSTATTMTPPDYSSQSLTSVSTSGSIGTGLATSVTPSMRQDEFGEDNLGSTLQIGSLDWDSLFAIDDFDNLLPNLTESAAVINTTTSHIPSLYYTIRDIQSSRLLIGLQDQQVCWMDMDVDDITLSSRFEQAFPSICYTHLLIESCEGDKEIAAMNRVVEAVVVELDSIPTFSAGADTESKVQADCRAMGPSWMGVG